MPNATNDTATVRVAANAHCRVAEQPFWDVIHQRLIWVDIPEGRLFHLNPRTGTWQSFYNGDPVGGFAQQDDGSFLLFRVHDICRLYWDGTLEPIVANTTWPITRFNDVLAGPDGRVYAGSKCHEGSHSAGVFRLDTSGSLEQLFAGTTIANGMAFSADLRTFYWTDTSARTIYAFDYDRTTGALSGRRELIVIPPGEGVPDGLTVDVEGCLWSARFNGGAVHRYSPDGHWLSRIDLPVAQVTAVTFGGLDFRTIYITTGGGEEGSNTLDGAVFSARSEVRGRPEFFARVQMPDPRSESTR